MFLLMAEAGVMMSEQEVAYFLYQAGVIGQLVQK